MPDLGPVWEPRSRLDGRVTTGAPRRLSRSSNHDPRVVAAIIVIAAGAIAVALWLAALWAQGRGSEEPIPVEETATSVIGMTNA